MLFHQAHHAFFVMDGVAVITVGVESFGVSRRSYSPRPEKQDRLYPPGWFFDGGLPPKSTAH
ncbi:MAG: hypothetical protein VX776_06775, partial [Planctomycetota bacterium]|nr:hypothetical protein [Planctomycetota bacterium]